MMTAVLRDDHDRRRCLIQSLKDFSSQGGQWADIFELLMFRILEEHIELTLKTELEERTGSGSRHQRHQTGN